MLNKWEEKYLASVIMNMLGTALAFVCAVLFYYNIECPLTIFFGLSGVICCNVACINL